MTNSLKRQQLLAILNVINLQDVTEDSQKVYSMIDALQKDCFNEERESNKEHGLNVGQRDKVKELLVEYYRDGMFDYEGVTNILMNGLSMVGFNYMTDKQLVVEYRQMVENGDDDDEFLNELEIEMAIDKVLRS